MHELHWFLDFIGVNNTYNSFSTHMYNFWSGFGGNISVLALIGAGIGMYRRHLKSLESLKRLEIHKFESLDPHLFTRKKDDKPDNKDK